MYFYVADIKHLKDTEANVAVMDEKTIILKVVHELESIFKKSKIFTSVLAVPTANVPIIKLYHQESRILIDLNCSGSPMGIYNSEMLKYYIGLNSQYRMLFFVVKKILKLSKIKLSFYTMQHLLVFFILRQDHKMYTPSELLSTVPSRARKLLQTFQVNFDENEVPADSHCDQPLKSLLVGFFQTLLNMCKASGIVVVNVHKAVYVDTSVFDLNSRNYNEQQTPKSYLNYVKKGYKPIELNKLLNVQDFLHLGNNLTSKIEQKTIDDLVRLSSELLVYTQQWKNNLYGFLLVAKNFSGP